MKFAKSLLKYVLWLCQASKLPFPPSACVGMFLVADPWLEEEKSMVFFNFSVFQLQLTCNIILASGVQRHRHLYNLRRNPPAKSSTHLAPYIFISIVLAILPLLYFTSLGLFCNCQFVFLHPITVGKDCFERPTLF